MRRMTDGFRQEEAASTLRMTEILSLVESSPTVGRSRSHAKQPFDLFEQYLRHLGSCERLSAVL